MRFDERHIMSVADPEWAAFVESRPEATPFHHPAWTDVIAKAYGLDGFAFVVRDSEGVITTGLPIFELGRRRRWASLPFTDHCDPLGQFEDIEGLIVSLEAERRRRGLTSVTIRSEEGLGRSVWTGGLRHVLTIDRPADELFQRFDRSQVQRAIKKAEREGARVRISERREDLTETFYSLHLSTRRRLGVPIQPQSFFDRLWERMIAAGLGVVFVVEVEGVPCSAGVFLAWNGKVIYKYGASDQRMWSHRPNHALFWRAIQWSAENGFNTFDFGRTDLNNEGLRSFKAKWGTVESELRYSVLGGAPPKRANSAATRALGALIQHSPEIVCRQVGKYFYRYAA